MTSQEDQAVSLSSVEHNRDLRIAKLAEIRAAGFDPYSVESKRDFKLDFVKFWFDFIHKNIFDEVVVDISPLTLDYFLHQVLFPKNLLEQAEEMIQIRAALKSMGLDPDDDRFKGQGIPEKIVSYRGYFAELSAKSDEEKYSLLSKYLSIRTSSDGGKKELKPNLEKGNKVTLAGRIKSKRVSGKIGFATVEDESLSNGFQFLFRSDLLESKEGSMSFEQYRDLIDAGDYIQAIGELDYSRTGEPSLMVESFVILTKALRPLPEKIDYDNLEYRYLNRVADFKYNTVDANGLTVRDMLRKKSRYWQIWREELLNLGFLEVECPVFEHTPGGAEAKPFTTHYDLLDQDMYLRISLELPLKRMIAGGFEKVFEIGRIFRNEGASFQHLQEYTQMEFYWAYADYTDCMRFIQRVYRRIITETLGTLETVDYNGNTINWGHWISDDEADKNNWKLENGWPLVSFYDAVRYYSGGKADIEGKDLEALRIHAKELGVKFEPTDSKPRLMDLIWKKTARPQVINPIFLTLPPVELEPLAKRDPVKTDLTQRFQIVAGTAELGKGFSELNDPLDQLSRFEEQQAARDAGDEEAQHMDTEYVEALEYGLPPLTGFGISERFFSFILGKPIKECVTFPAVRKEATEENPEG